MQSAGTEYFFLKLAILPEAENQKKAFAIINAHFPNQEASEDMHTALRISTAINSTELKTKLFALWTALQAADIQFAYPETEENLREILIQPGALPSIFYMESEQDNKNLCFSLNELKAQGIHLEQLILLGDQRNNIHTKSIRKLLAQINALKEEILLIENIINNERTLTTTIQLIQRASDFKKLVILFKYNKEVHFFIEHYLILHPQLQPLFNYLKNLDQVPEGNQDDWEQTVIKIISALKLEQVKIEIEQLENYLHFEFETQFPDFELDAETPRQAFIKKCPAKMQELLKKLITLKNEKSFFKTATDKLISLDEKNFLVEMEKLGSHNRHQYKLKKELQQLRCELVKQHLTIINKQAAHNKLITPEDKQYRIDAQKLMDAAETLVKGLTATHSNFSPQEERETKIALVDAFEKQAHQLPSFQKPLSFAIRKAIGCVIFAALGAILGIMIGTAIEALVFGMLTAWAGGIGSIPGAAKGAITGGITGWALGLMAASACGFTAGAAYGFFSIQHKDKIDEITASAKKVALSKNIKV